MTRSMRASATLAVLAALAFSGGARAEVAMGPQSVVDGASGDFNKDGLSDLALLVATNPDDMAIGLYVYLRGEDGVLQLAASKPDAVWGSWGEDGMAGQEPSLAALPNGSISVSEQNESIGRDRWRSTRTIAWRDGRFLVAGYTFESRDTLQEEDPLSCDLNLLTGKGIVDGRRVSFTPLTITVQDWRGEAGENPGLRICRAP